jgi:hypothetical protein
MGFVSYASMVAHSKVPLDNERKLLSFANFPVAHFPRAAVVRQSGKGAEITVAKRWP